MAIQPPREQPPPVSPKVKDVDDEHVDRRDAEVRPNQAQVRQQEGRGPKGTKAREAERAAAKKPGHDVGKASDEDEGVYEKEARPDQLQGGFDAQAKKDDGVKKIKTPKTAGDKREDQPGRGKKGGGSDGDGDAEKEAPRSMTLAALASEKRVNLARDLGFQTTPGLSEVVKGKLSAVTGESFAEVLPVARKRTSLPEPDMSPPPFLSSFEAMKDIYLRVKGRASPRTKELLEGPDLEDLVKMLGELHENDELKRRGEAQVKGSIYVRIKDDPGPLLRGLNDERLTEPWRLFLDGWDIWVPEKKKEEDAGGVELFWEGEAEDDSGEDIAIVQSVALRGGEITLATRFGDDADEVVFDGTTYFRLKKRTA